MSSFNFAPTGAIFDLDDTLLDNYKNTSDGVHESLRLQAVHAMGEKYSFPKLMAATMEESKQAFHTAHANTFEYATWNMLCMYTLRNNPAQPQFDDPLLKELTEYKEALYSEFLRNAPEIPGSTDFVKRIHDKTGGAVAIGSSAKRPVIEAYLDSKQIGSLFDSSRIISLESVERPKPSPEVFDKAFRSLKLADSDRGSTLVFEDDPRGIMAGKAAGLYVCAVTTRFDRESLQALEVPPDFVFDAYSELVLV